MSDHGAPGGQANQKYRRGMTIENLAHVIIRREEELDSPIVHRLMPNSRAEVLQIGTGPSGKRIRIQTNDAPEGWVSVIAQSGNALWRTVSAGGGAAEAGSGPAANLAGAAAAGAALPGTNFRRLQAAAPAAAKKAPARAEAFSWQKRSQAMQAKSRADAEATSRLEAEAEQRRKHAQESEEEGKQAAEEDESKPPPEQLFSGVGQTLGGSGQRAADPRAAMLAAAERRQASAISHGVGERKAKQLQERDRRESLLSKIGEIYARRREDVPAAIQSAGVAGLQRHLEELQAAPAASSSSSSSQPVQQATSSQHQRFQPPPRTPAEQPLHPLADAIISDILADPKFQSSLAHVAWPPEVIRLMVQSVLDGNPDAAAAEPRLEEELLRVFGSGGALKGQPDGQPPQAPLLPALASQDELRAQMLEETRTLCGLSAPQIQAVLDLEALGYSYERALEAYISCDKNKELAANYLFDTPAPEAEAEVTASAPAAFPGPAPRDEDAPLLLGEWEAVQRIQELGFDRPTSLKAYLACGKDEELAGNRLLM